MKLKEAGINHPLTMCLIIWIFLPHFSCLNISLGVNNRRPHCPYIAGVLNFTYERMKYSSSPNLKYAIITWRCNCQAQFKLASSVQVQLRTENGLICEPHPPVQTKLRLVVLIHILYFLWTHGALVKLLDIYFS